MLIPIADRVAAIDRITEQIRKLSQRQREAFDEAVFVGMSSKVARECEERRQEIMRLVGILARFTKSNVSQESIEGRSSGLDESGAQHLQKSEESHRSLRNIH